MSSAERKKRQRRNESPNSHRERLRLQRECMQRLRNASSATPELQIPMSSTASAAIPPPSGFHSAPATPSMMPPPDRFVSGSFSPLPPSIHPSSQIFDMNQVPLSSPSPFPSSSGFESVSVVPQFPSFPDPRFFSGFCVPLSHPVHSSRQISGSSLALFPSSSGLQSGPVLPHMPSFPDPRFVSGLCSPPSPSVHPSTHLYPISQMIGSPTFGLAPFPSSPLLQSVSAVHPLSSFPDPRLVSAVCSPPSPSVHASTQLFPLSQMAGSSVAPLPSSSGLPSLPIALPMSSFPDPQIVSATSSPQSPYLQASTHVLHPSQDRTSSSLCHVRKRAAETDESHTLRLENARLSQQKRRAEHTAEEHAAELHSNADQHRRSRAAETTDEHMRRLHLDAVRHQMSRDSENPEERSSRLQSDRDRHRNQRQGETEMEQLDRRLIEINQRIALREAGLWDDYLHRHRQSQQRHLANQSATQRTDRLARASEAYRNARQRNLQGMRNNPFRGRLPNPSPIPHYVAFTDNCNICNAQFFNSEFPDHGGSKVFCCHRGEVQFERFPNFPAELKQLYEGECAEAKNFRKNLRHFNNSFAMASYNATVAAPPGRGPFSYRVFGQTFHCVGSVVPTANRTPQYAQIYFMDSAEASAIRAGHPLNTNCLPHLFDLIGGILSNVNPHVQSFHYMKDVIADQEIQAARNCSNVPNVSITFVQPTGVDPRRYNTPTAEEISVVYVADDGQLPTRPRGVTLHTKRGGIRNINDIDPNVDPLSYPLFFPTGVQGWSINMPREGSEERISISEYYRYLTMIRPTFNPLLRGGALFQQFCVDAWLKEEKNRTDFLRLKQKDFFVDTRKGLTDHLASDDPTAAVGSRILLPSSFKGGRRFMQQAYMDAMTIVGKYGQPDLFVTMTTNPRWPEITEQLLPHQTAADRPDLVTRVFHMKLKELMSDLKSKNVLGRTTAYVAAIEFQKRGLPHAHILLTFDGDCKPRSATDIDSLIAATIPSEDNPRLRELVLTHMVHRKCGQYNPSSTCMKNGACSKSFPKPFADSTTTTSSGYPTYVRPDDGSCAEIGGTTIDNSWIVPYNPYLLEKYGCHINVEIVGTLHVVKYLFKYVLKGPDRARIEVTTGRGTVDEIKQHIDCRYVSPPEALHRIYGFPLDLKSDTVYRLQCHLPDEESITFDPEDPAAALNRRRKDTTLTAWMKYNAGYKERSTRGTLTPNEPNALDLLYTEFPQNFVFSKNSWTIRKKGGGKTIGRLYNVSPRDTERFSLRLLLLHIKGATSFDDLRSFDGVLYDTYREAAYARELLDDERMITRMLEEAESYQMPSEMRSLFASVVAFCEVQDVAALWNRFIPSLREDFQHQGYSEEISTAKTFYDTSDRLRTMGITLASFVTAPEIRREDIPESPVNIRHHRAIADELISNLNVDQRRAFDAICSAVTQNQQALAFIDGPGGTGKTYVYIAIYHHLIASGKKIQASAWTGIAAGLLPNGRTCSSLFKLPVDSDSRTSSMKAQSPEAAQLRAVDVLIIDEISMISRHTFAAIDQLLRDITRNDVPFGGKTVVIGGDFRQTLPIVRREGHEGSLDACIKNGPLWNHFEIFSLRLNMRAKDDPTWANYVLEIGNGTEPADENSRINLPTANRCDRDIVTATFGPLLDSNSEELSNSAILAPRNSEVDRLNETALCRMSGPLSTLLSVDTIVADDADQLLQLQQDYTVEFLHSIRPPSTPPHKLHLKPGCPLMLLKNLDVQAGLCNGTRLILLSIGRNILMCEFANGARKGQKCLIPRIHCYADQDLPFRLRRTQFPVVLAFAVTVNKAQGQTLSRVGIYLQDDVFAHGQLYVALSRAMKSSDVVVYSPRPRVLNVVDRSIL